MLIDRIEALPCLDAFDAVFRPCLTRLVPAVMRALAERPRRASAGLPSLRAHAG